MVVAPGTWVSAATAGKLSAKSTLDALKAPAWPDTLRIFHTLAFSAIGRAIAANQENIEDRIAARAEGSARLTDRVVGSFHNVAERSRGAWERARTRMNGCWPYS